MHALPLVGRFARTATEQGTDAVSGDVEHLHATDDHSTQAGHDMAEASNPSQFWPKHAPGKNRSSFKLAGCKGSVLDVS